MRIKDRLHRTFSLVLLSVLSFMGFAILLLTRENSARELDKELSQTSLLIYKTVKNVFELNEKILLGNIKVIESDIKTLSVDSSRMIDSDAEHYITRLTDYVRVPTLTINGKPVFGSTEFVDEIAALTGGNVSVLQLFPQGLLQIATSIRRPDGSRATQIYYPSSEKVTQEIRAGRTYVGKAFEMNEWHIVAYRPLFFDGEPVGAVYAGIKPDIADLRRHILDIRIGRTGRPFVVDTEGILVIDAEETNQNVYHLSYIKKMINDRADGTVTYDEPAGSGGLGGRRIVNYRYLSEMEWIVAAGSYEREFFENQEIISRIIVISLLVAFLVAVVVAFQISDAITRPINSLTESMNAVKELKYDFKDSRAVAEIKTQLLRTAANEDEIKVMTGTFYGMIEELEGAHRQLISKYRRYREMEIAKKVEAMLLPDLESLHGYELSSRGNAAATAFGQFFDITEGPGGSVWYLVGSAKERSLAAGFIMSMAQSSVNSILKSLPDASAEEIVDMVNGGLVERLRDRTGADDFQSLSILVVRPDGAFRYAGPLERLLRYDRAAGKTLTIETREIGGGAPGRTRTAEFFVGRGDLVVLDGEDRRSWVRILEDYGGERPEELLARVGDADGRAPGPQRAASPAFLARRN